MRVVGVVGAGGFPNPISWAADQATGLAGGVAAQGFRAVVGGLSGWVLDAVGWVVGAVFAFFLGATDPNVQADWFSRGQGPYPTVVAIAAMLLAGFVLLDVIHGVVVGDPGGMVRRVVVDLPMAVFAMVALVGVTAALVAATDEVSRGVLDRFGGDVHRFTAALTAVSSLNGPTASAFVVCLLAIVSVLAGIALIAELVVRAALIYIVVALAPLVFAVQVWPALRGAGRKLLELLAALIVSKLVVAIALAVAAAAAVGAGSGGQTTALAPPETFASGAGSITHAVGLLLAAAAAFGVAAFSPFLVARLLPMTEAAVVAAGIRPGAMRAGQQTMASTTTARSRLASLAGGRTTAPSSGAAGGAVAAGAATGGAVAAAGLATKAATGAAGTGARAATAPVHANPPRPNPPARSSPPSRSPRTGRSDDAS